MSIRDEIKKVYDSATNLADELGITRQEAFLLLITYQLSAIHYHIDVEVNKKK